MDGLIVSLIKRPYVFIFLLSYLSLALIKWRLPRVLLWLITGYAIAWLSEFSSIHNGFPYGEYHYIYNNMPGELMVFGVPFFDSLSYVFLCFAGFTMATTLFQNDAKQLNTSIKSMIRLIFWGAFLTTAIDIIVDPVAKQGGRWFLGEIYYYAVDGAYFHVPLSNFGGWLLTTFCIIGINAILWRLFPRFLKERSPFTLPIIPYLYPLFYFSIILFNIAITIYIAEYTMACASICITLAIAMTWFLSRKLSLPQKNC